MGAAKLTTSEAKRLIAMTKHALISEINFPSKGQQEEFDVVGDTKIDIFSIKIFRGKIRSTKYNIGARLKKNGIVLLELHINPSNVHINPNGEKIKGSHWHVYSEEYGRTQAFPAQNIEDDAFVDNTIDFLIKFNIVEQPNILLQLELA